MHVADGPPGDVEVDTDADLGVVRFCSLGEQSEVVAVIDDGDHAAALSRETPEDVSLVASSGRTDAQHVVESELGEERGLMGMVGGQPADAGPALLDDVPQDSGAADRLGCNADRDVGALDRIEQGREVCIQRIQIDQCCRKPRPGEEGLPAGIVACVGQGSGHGGMVYHGLWVCHHWPGVEWRPGGYCAGMDLDAATLRALDWPAVLTALARHARTTLGAARAQTLELVNTPDAARRHYRAVAEVLHLEAEAGGRIPVGAVTDIREPLTRAVRGTVLEAEDLRAVGHALDAMDQLKRWLEDRGENAPELDALAAPIRIDASLRDDLQESFDATGRISGDRYPDLADLRARTGALKDRIQQVLDELVRGDSLGGALQDRYVTERGGRFVIPVRAGQNRRGLGIVHATSQSGETVFVEPAEVVERTNQLKEVEGAVTRVERRILGRLSTQVAAQAPAVLAALAAATEIDLACARAGLGGALDGVIPEVQGSGVLRLSAARHPVLALRGVDVVANDLAVGGGAVGLVLSGPNTGGKTIAMKTLGLAALFVRAGVPFPAAEGSRVDVFVDVPRGCRGPAECRGRPVHLLGTCIGASGDARARRQRHPRPP